MAHPRECKPLGLTFPPGSLALYPLLDLGRPRNATRSTTSPAAPGHDPSTCGATGSETVPSRWEALLSTRRRENVKALGEEQTTSEGARSDSDSNATGLGFRGSLQDNTGMIPNECVRNPTIRGPHPRPNEKRSALEATLSELHL